MVLLDTFAPLFSEFIEFDAKLAVKIPFLSKNARIQEYKNTRIQEYKNTSKGAKFYFP